MKLMFRKEYILDPIMIVNIAASTGQVLSPILSHLPISTTDDPLETVLISPVIEDGHI